MSCYEALAASYDGLTRDIPYEKYLRFFKTLLRRYGVKAATVLDLACGTGSLSVLLAKHGYRVLGVDRSEEMLTVARALETPVEISHLKAIGRRNWRSAVPRMLERIQRARQEGLDVTCDVTLQPWEAVFGTKKRVPTLDGEVELNIPAGSSSGRRLRIRGRGLGPATGRGDEYVTVAISVPKPEDLNEEQLKLWKALAGQK